MPRALPPPRRAPPGSGAPGGVSDLRAGAGGLAGSGRRREPGTPCEPAEPGMASAGGGDCEGAAPEADRPHHRPFLIGVSGGTASGKVRGWAARRGLLVSPRPPTLGDGGPIRPPAGEETPASWLPRRPLRGGGWRGEGWRGEGLRPWWARLGCRQGLGRLPSGSSQPPRRLPPRPAPPVAGLVGKPPGAGGSGSPEAGPVAGAGPGGNPVCVFSSPLCVRRSWSCWARTKWTTGSGSWSS